MTPSMQGYPAGLGPNRWRTHSWALVIFLVVFAVVGADAFYVHVIHPAPVTATASRKSAPTASIPSSVLQAVEHPSASELETVGTGSMGGSPFVALPAGTAVPPLREDGKPEVFFEGAEYCPYCAAERWSMIIALSRFGSFSGLTLVQSSATDVFPDTRSFGFAGATYTSPYLDFIPLEIENESGQSLETPTPAEEELVSLVNSLLPSSEQNAIPFYTLGNLYAGAGSGYSPEVLAGMSWVQIASAIGTAGTPQAQAVLGNANYLTAGICTEIRNAAPACAVQGMQALEAKLG